MSTATKNAGRHPGTPLPTARTEARSSAPATSRRLRGILCLDDFEPAAKGYLPRPLFGYVAGSAERGQGYAGNRAAYDALDFVTRVLVDVGTRDQSARLFGKSYKHPFGIAPMGMGAAIAYDGDVMLSREAAEAEIPFVLSASSLTTMERVTGEGGARWYQAYLPGDEHRIETLVARVRNAGFDTFVLTADVPVAANRENNVRNGFTIPLRPSLSLALQGASHPGWLFNTAFRTLLRRGMPHFENMDAFQGPPLLSRNLVRAIGNRDQLSWKHVEFIRSIWPGTLVVKGLVSAADAVLARESGADGIIVSNHGGRQLDGVLAPLRSLGQIREAVGPDMTVMIDGGIRRGTDVLKALALGADFVFVGRPFLYAAAYGGGEGVQHAVNILAQEIDRNMAMLGVRELEELSPAYVRERIAA